MPEKLRQYTLKFNNKLADLTVNEQAIGLGRCALTYQGNVYYCKEEAEAMQIFVSFAQ